MALSSYDRWLLPDDSGFSGGYVMTVCRPLPYVDNDEQEVECEIEFDVEVEIDSGCVASAYCNGVNIDLTDGESEDAVMRAEEEAQDGRY